VQLVSGVEALADEENAGHSRHAPAPVSFLKVPAGHAAHAPPFAPVKPALQAQAAAEVLAGCEMEFGGQALHPGMGAPVDVSSELSASDASVKSLSERW